VIEVLRAAELVDHREVVLGGFGTEIEEKRLLA
jgi:hypothetical protein